MSLDQTGDFYNADVFQHLPASWAFAGKWLATCDNTDLLLLVDAHFCANLDRHELRP